jgi:multimeric flavodoxin WrbA
VVVAQNRGGGQESTIHSLHHFFFIHDMIVVGCGPEQRPGCYLGASAFSGIVGEERETATRAVLEDEVGIRAARMVGRRVAEAVKIVFSAKAKPLAIPQ